MFKAHDADIIKQQFNIHLETFLIDQEKRTGTQATCADHCIFYLNRYTFRVNEQATVDCAGTQYSSALKNSNLGWIGSEGFQFDSL